MSKLTYSLQERPQGYILTLWEDGMEVHWWTYSKRSPLTSLTLPRRIRWLENRRGATARNQLPLAFGARTVAVQQLSAALSPEERLRQAILSGSAPDPALLREVLRNSAPQ